MSKESPLEQLNFDGRVAIITGAGAGLGREYALLLASRGARIVANDASLKDVEAVVAEISASGGKAVVSHGDVRTDAKKCVADAMATFGQLDILINNAGIYRPGHFWEQDVDEWWHVFDVSLKGTVDMIRAAWPELERSRSGRIVNTSSIGIMPQPNASAYGAAKAAIWALGGTLGLESATRGTNVLVNTLMPVALTSMMPESFFPQDIGDALREHFQPSRVAAFVTWLVHQDTQITQRTFQVGGGSIEEILVCASPMINTPENSPEGWALAAISDAADSGDVTIYRSVSDSFMRQMLSKSPHLKLSHAAVREHFSS